MTNEDALLRAIALNPDDATPRLVYADYLEEQGRSGEARLRRDRHTRRFVLKARVPPGTSTDQYRYVPYWRCVGHADGDKHPVNDLVRGHVVPRLSPYVEPDVYGQSFTVRLGAVVGVELHHLYVTEERLAALFAAEPIASFTLRGNRPNTTRSTWAVYGGACWYNGGHWRTGGFRLPPEVFGRLVGNVPHKSIPRGVKVYADAAAATRALDAAVVAYGRELAAEWVAARDVT